MNDFQTFFMSGDISAHTKSLHPRDKNSSSSSEDMDSKAPVPAATTLEASESAMAASASTSDDLWTVLWRHVLASHWCHADMRGSVNLVLCVCHIWMGMSCLSCGYYHGNEQFFLYNRLCRSTLATFSLIIATFVLFRYFVLLKKT